MQAQIVAIAPVQHGDVVPALHQALDNVRADELGAADNHGTHGRMIARPGDVPS